MDKKEIIKNTIMYIGCFYILIITGIIILNYCTATKSIEINDNEDNLKLLEEYKKEVNNISDLACRNSINDFIKQYERTSFNGKINLKDWYKVITKEDAILSYYSKIKESCKITNEESNRFNLPYLFLSSSIQNEEILQKSYFQYELHLKDYFLRNIADTYLYGVEYNLQRQGSRIIISNLIQMEKERN